MGFNSLETFIKNEGVLAEKESSVDFLDFSQQVRNLSDKINTQDNSLIGLIGGFGKGKSSLIEQTKEYRKDKLANKELWINFEAWKFPERKELWEGFVLEVARQIDPKEFEKVFKRIEGKQNDDKKTLINTLGSIPTLSVVKNLSHFFETSPAKRIFQIEKIFENLLSKIKDKERIIIVVEDTDRSGPEGIYFVETLKHFLKSNDFNKKINIILPISEKSFNESNQESYLKSLDVVEFLDSSNIDFRKLIDEAFIDEISERDKALVNDFFKYQMRSEPDTTIRKIKFILRKANINQRVSYSHGNQPEWLITLLIEASKMFPSPTTKGVSAYETFKNMKVIKKENIYASFLLVVFSKYANVGVSNLLNHEGNKINPKLDFKFTNRKGNSELDITRKPSYPYVAESSIDPSQNYWLPDFYFNY